MSQRNGSFLLTNISQWFVLRYIEENATLQKVATQAEVPQVKYFSAKRLTISPPGCFGSPLTKIKKRSSVQCKKKAELGPFSEVLNIPILPLCCVCGSHTQSRQSAKPFLKSSELGLPQPLTRRRVCPPFWFRGEGHTRCRYRGRDSPNSNEGTYTVVLKYMLCTLWSHMKGGSFESKDDGNTSCRLCFSQQLFPNRLWE